MKKLLFLLIAMYCFTSVKGQSNKGDLTIAPQIGLNFSNYGSSENLSNKIRTSINAGATIEYYFSDRWSLRSGLLYDSKGTKVSFSDGDYIDQLNYLAIPIHANWHFGSNRNWFLNFGPTLGFIISAKSDTPDGTLDIKDELASTFDFGLGAGIGYKFNVSENAELFFQYQTFNGFVSIFDLDYISLFNLTSAINVGVVLDL